MAALASSSGRTTVRSARPTSPRKPLAAFSPLVILTFGATVFGGLECLVILYVPGWHMTLCGLILWMVFSFNVLMYRHLCCAEHNAQKRILRDAISRARRNGSR